MSALVSTRVGGRRGGIVKRTFGSRFRVDRDGDLDMDAPQNGRGKGRGGGGPKRSDGRSISIYNAPKENISNQTARGGSGAMRTGAKRQSGRGPVGTRLLPKASGSRNGQSRGYTGPVVGIRVTGWHKGRGSFHSCSRFLENKTTLKFIKTTMIGGDMIVYVPASDMQKVLDWNMVEFSGVNLKITADMVEDIFNLSMKDATPRNSNLSETIKILDEVLRIRYNPEIKLLDLSHLGNDVLLKQNGFFELGSTTSKMFPALMSIADKKFTNNEQKRDWLHSVSLAGNNLKNIAPVTALSIVFPDLKNLSLDGNLIEDMKGLDGWRSRFRNLEQLILLGNPVVYAPGYKEEMLRRYPKLVMLDNVVIDRLQIQIGNQNAPSRSQSAQRPVTATGLKGEPILPLTIKDNLLVDTNGLAMSFLTSFFSQIDNNKDDVLKQFYTPTSKFSLSVNTSAPKVEGMASWQHWEIYLPRSRNMMRVREPGGLIERLAQGPEEIRKLWDSLPRTQHNMDILELWSFDIFPVEISVGVNGLLATVHSEYDEINTSVNSGNGGVIKRSFDRSFTLVTDATGGVKVASDMIVVRGYSGATAWRVNSTIEPFINNEQPAVQPAVQTMVQPVVTAEPTMEEEQRKCQMLSEKTGLNLKYAEMCLVDTNWDLASAWDAFMWAKDSLGPEAFAK